LGRALTRRRGVLGLSLPGDDRGPAPLPEIEPVADEIPAGALSTPAWQCRPSPS